MEIKEGRDRSRGFALWGLIVGFLLGAVLAAALTVWFTSWGREAHPEGRRIDLSQPTVLSKIQQLERLETVLYQMEKIVTGEREIRYLPQFLSGDRLLLIVHGEVIAGIDLSKVQSEDISVRDNVLQLKIPTAELLTVRIDNERTRVYSRETGLFSRVDPHLETDVRREAERQLREAAMEEGLLEMADKNARATLLRLLESFGFERVEL